MRDRVEDIPDRPEPQQPCLLALTRCMPVARLGLTQVHVHAVLEMRRPDQEVMPPAVHHRNDRDHAALRDERRRTDRRPRGIRWSGLGVPGLQPDARDEVVDLLGGGTPRRQVGAVQAEAVVLDVDLIVEPPQQLCHVNAFALLMIILSWRSMAHCTDNPSHAAHMSIVNASNRGK
ncbi:hypothetical protein ACFYOK_17030 [Microbispora bryophytorum]|uniref:hypothetical protein n=1 Tax=Microbispora bryophytorum TaxID=1460882 RepID=UPI0033F14195